MRRGPTLLLPLTPIRIDGVQEPRGTATVTAELLPDLAPHLAAVASFAMHEEPGCSLMQWKVSNIETGLKVSVGLTPEEAIWIAKQQLASKTVEDILDAYRKAPPTARCEP